MVNDFIYSFKVNTYYRLELDMGIISYMDTVYFLYVYALAMVFLKGTKKMKPKFEIGQTVYYLSGWIKICSTKIDFIEIHKNYYEYVDILGDHHSECCIFASSNELIDHYLKEFEGMRE